MMETVFLKLLNMSIAASWLVLAVIVLRWLLKRAPKSVRCVLGGLVALRLICPFTLESAFSLIPVRKRSARTFFMRRRRLSTAAFRRSIRC